MPKGRPRGKGMHKSPTQEASHSTHFPPPRILFFRRHVVTLSHFEHNQLRMYTLWAWRRVTTVWQQREFVVTRISPYLSVSSLPPWQRDNKKWVFSIGGEREYSLNAFSATLIRPLPPTKKIFFCIIKKFSIPLRKYNFYKRKLVALLSKESKGGQGVNLMIRNYY